MRALNWDLMQIQKRNRDGSYATRRARAHALAQAANTLHGLGYKGLRATGLRGKHVDALVREWLRQGLSPGTVKNRMAHLRWWAQHVGKPGVVHRDNSAYGIGERRYVTNEDRSRELPREKLDLVGDRHVRMSLRLQAAFGLRREESIKFVPSFADRGDVVVLRPSWTKGGKGREIPVLDEGQRRVLDDARRLARGGALIPPGRDYRVQRRLYERQTSEAGLNRMHGLRHAYAQRRYEELVGWKAPVNGGPSRRTLAGPLRDADWQARLRIARELGHERGDVISVYIGN